MKRKMFPIVTSFLTLAMILLPVSVVAQSTAGITGAGSGSFSAGVTYVGLSLSALDFGIGTLIPGDGSAEGQFKLTMVGTTILGLSQTIEVEGEAVTGSITPGVTGTVSGTASIDLGDGLPPLIGLPFTVTATPTSVAVTLGPTSLPAVPLTAGTIAIQ
jgi:hypothetical protein